MIAQPINVFVVSEGDEYLAESLVHRSYIMQVLALVHQITVTVAHAVDQERAYPKSCSANSVMLTALGQLYANSLHMLAATEDRLNFNADVDHLLKSVFAQVEAAEAQGEGGGTA